MPENNLKKEVTRKEDGRILIYYTWQADGREKDQSEAITGRQVNGGAVEK